MVKVTLPSDSAIAPILTAAAQIEGGGVYRDHMETIRKHLLGARNRLSGEITATPESPPTDEALRRELANASCPMMQYMLNLFPTGLEGDAHVAARLLLVSGLVDSILKSTMMKKRYAELVTKRENLVAMQIEIEGCLKWLIGGDISLAETDGDEFSVAAPSAPAEATVAEVLTAAEDQADGPAVVGAASSTVAQPKDETAAEVASTRSPVKRQEVKAEPVQPTLSPFPPLRGPHPQQALNRTTAVPPTAAARPPSTAAPKTEVKTEVLTTTRTATGRPSTTAATTVTQPLATRTTTTAPTTTTTPVQRTTANLRGTGDQARRPDAIAAMFVTIGEKFKEFWEHIATSQIVTVIDGLVGSWARVMTGALLTVAFIATHQVAAGFRAAVATTFATYRWFALASEVFFPLITTSALTVSSAAVVSGSYFRLLRWPVIRKALSAKPGNLRFHFFDISR